MDGTKDYPSVEYIRSRDGDSCSYCGVFFSEQGTARSLHRPSRDHIVPRSMGGEDVPSNMVIACVKCNSSRGSLSPIHWLWNDKLKSEGWMWRVPGGERNALSWGKWEPPVDVVKPVAKPKVVKKKAKPKPVKRRGPVKNPINKWSRAFMGGG